MTLTPQLRKIAIKKIASHPSSFREPDIYFRKLVDKIEQAKITMKLEETENCKLQYVNNIQTTNSQINYIHDSDTQILNIYEKNLNFTGNHHSKSGVTIAVDIDSALLNVDKINKILGTNLKNIEKQISHFTNT